MDKWTLNDLLECSVCLERLDTSSKVLPCQHTFCKKCLEKIVSTHKELRCPECRILVDVKIEDLPPNVLLMRILEGMRNAAPKKRNAVPNRLQGSISPAPATVQQIAPLQQQQHIPTHAATISSDTRPHTGPKQHVVQPNQPYARAICDYLSSEPGDLCFKKGDIILLRKQIGNNQYHGESGGKHGVFPLTYVQVVTPLPSHIPQCKALCDFRMTNDDEEGCLTFNKAKAKITHLQEQHRQMKDAVSMYDTAISSSDASVISDASLNIKPEFRDPEYTRIAMVNGGSPVEHNKGFTGNAKDPFSGFNGPAGGDGSSDFGGEDMFKDDPFKSTKTNHTVADPFSSNDPFSAAFSSKSSDTFTADPFSSFGATTTSAKNDPFDPFGDGGAERSASKTPVDVSGKDPFGCDPFATLQPASSGPPPRPESPSPALPPKKSKQPPPHPAPPRPLQQPTMRAAPLPPTPSPDPTAMSGAGASRDPFSNPGTQVDPFAADPFGGRGSSATPTPAAQQHNPFSNSSVAFADFANFDSKFSEAADEVSSQTVSTATRGSATTKAAAQHPQHLYAGLEFTEDPFRNYCYEDPFNISDLFDDERNVKSSPATGAKLDPFGLETDSGFASEFPTPTSKMNGGVSTDPFAAGLGLKAHTNIPPEDQQLAWAAAESLRLEEERRKRLEQEQADLEYALALSREEKTRRKV